MATRIEDFSTEPERRDGVELLRIYIKKTGKGYSALAKEINLAAPEYHLHISRQMVQHWYEGRNLPGEDSFRPLKKFLSSARVRREVRQAEIYVSGAREAVLRFGSDIARRLYTLASPESRHRALAALSGYHLSMAGFSGDFRIAWRKGDDFAVFACCEHGSRRVFAGYVFHQTASAAIVSPDGRFRVEGGGDVFVLDARDVFSGAAIHQKFFYIPADEDLAPEQVPQRFGFGGFLAGDVGLPITTFRSAVGYPSDETDTQWKEFLDTMIWDVAAHGLK